MTNNATTESGNSACVITSTCHSLRHHLRDAENKPHAVRSEIARSARIATEISLGRGSQAHLHELKTLAKALTAQDTAAGATLSAALAAHPDVWDQHVDGMHCAANTCFEPRTAPCQKACPAGIDIPGMLAHIGHGEYQDATRLLIADNPLPYSCGLVCPAPCEDACLRGTVSSSVLIRPLKSVAARCSDGYPLPTSAAPTSKRIAIVGSGPAGLTAAFYLALRGHQVEIFEAREEAGGIMRYGIPHYRLPAEILRMEIDQVKALGVAIHTRTPIDNVKALKESGFDAVFIAIGLQNSKRLGVPGEDLPFVLGGMDFLSKVREGLDPRVGPHVIVIGGGNAAIDVAMTALRQGASKVQMWYRRTRKDMPANPHEVEMALAEGIELVELWAPVQVLPGNRIEFQRSKNAPDAATTPNIIVEADQIIAGIGQEASLDWLNGSGIEIKWGNIVTDPKTMATGEPGVFAGGDIAHGASTVVAAVGSGKRAAESIHAFVMNEASIVSVPQNKAIVALLPTPAKHRTHGERAEVFELHADKRKCSHQPIFMDLEEPVAQAEAGRCLRCDMCVGCGLCELVCTEIGVGALRMSETPSGRLVFEDFVRPAAHCIGCGACAAICPTGAIRVDDQGDRRITSITGTVVCEQSLQVCQRCDNTYVAASQHDAMRKKTGHESTCCPSCTRKQTAEAVLLMPW